MPDPTPAAFTVVIPAYNPGAMLREALQGVRQQTHPATWVVVVDDGSTDGSAEAARAWLLEFGLPGIVVEQANQGISTARNAGLAQRRSEIIALLDADDLWLPNHLANLHEAYTLCPEAIVAFGDSRFFGDPRSRTDLLARSLALPLSECALSDRVHRLSPAVFRRSLPGQFFPISASSFRMDRGPTEPRFATDLPIGEDRFLFLQLARSGPFVFVDEQSCRTRRHESNTTHSDRTTWLQENALLVLDKIRRDPLLALTPADIQIIDQTATRTASELLYSSSRCGMRAYRRGRKTVADHVPHMRRWSLRHFARALAATIAVAPGSMR